MVCAFDIRLDRQLHETGTKGHVDLEIEQLRMN
jgi:hypothetical protein